MKTILCKIMFGKPNNNGDFEKFKELLIEIPKELKDYTILGREIIKKGSKE